MAKSKARHHDLSEEELKQIVAEADTGGRKPTGVTAAIIAATGIAWSLFQLWFASPLPFVFEIGILNDTEARAIHLAFAVFLGFMAYPAFKRSPRAHVPVLDWALALIGAFVAGYLFLFYAALSERPGLPTTLDLVAAVVGLTLLLEAARRALGLPMVILALVFISYIFLGAYMPDVIAHRGASLGKGMNHLWL
ncbi:MAG: C4-dicarboxylate ABC transporter, partial [Rhodocyclaceae bacterium]|nr:C4-dicarboxylate ABC transporter [Rhodocyclaceae bacterium]